MLAKICTVIFFIGTAMILFGVGFPFLEIIVGVAALILGILALM